jgi:DHA1 family bicyclomycin/chloramphenicol resistance-like MFS transporter
MHPDADRLWPGPRWALALLLAAMGMLGPFAIDAYLPAFGTMAQVLSASSLQMQQTLSAFLLGFAVMNLFHGSLADAFGRRPVVLWGLAVFSLASVGCALTNSINALILMRGLQGLAAGAGMVVSRAIIRDLFAPADAQRVMSQVTIWFGVAPAVAPLVGGWLYVQAGWASVFWGLAVFGSALWLLVWRALPETLPPAHVQRFTPGPLLRGYIDMARRPQMLPLVVASGVPFNGMFLYVLAAPAFLGTHLQLAPTQYFWFFFVNVGGLMAGAWVSGRLAGRVAPERQVRLGFAVVGVASVANVVLNSLLAPHVAWALWPVTAYSFGWALLAPVVTLMVLDVVPERRGMAASLQAALGAAANALVAGLVVPLVMHSTLALAVASALLAAVGAGCWGWLRRQGR